MNYRIAALFGLAFILGTVVAGESEPPTVPSPLEKRISLDVLETDLAKGLKAIAEQTGLDLKLQNAETEEVWFTAVDFKLDDIRPVDLLEALSGLYDIEYRVEAGRLLIQRKQHIKEDASPLSLHIYDVDDILATGRTVGFDEIDSSSELRKSEFTSNIGCVFGPVNSGPTCTNVADMIRNRVCPESWDAALGTSIEERGGRIVVMQRENVHKQIVELLGAFRAERNRQIAVDCRFLSVRSVDMDRIRAGADARGVRRMQLDDAALDALQERVRAREAIQIFAGNAIGQNNQECRIQNIKQVRVTNDYEISGSTFDPVVQPRNTGAALRCEPTLSVDGTGVLLRLRASHSVLAGMEDVLVARGGMVEVSTPRESKITTRSGPKKREGGEKEDAGEAQQPNPAQPKAAEPVETEVVVEKNEPPLIHMLPATGPHYCQLAAFGFARLSQDIHARVGKTLALSMPMHGNMGIEPGRELVLLVRADVINVGPTREPAPKPKATPEPPAKPKPQPSENVAKLLAKPLVLKLEKITAQVALESIAKAAALPLFHPAQGIPMEKREQIVNINAAGRPAGKVLEKLLADIDCVMQPFHSVLLITRSEKPKQHDVDDQNNKPIDAILRIYDVREITSPAQDHPGPINALPYGSGTPASPFGESDVRGGMQSADLASLLKERIFPEDFADPVTAIEESGDKLVVLNTVEVHEKILAKLNEMRTVLKRSAAMTVRWAIVDTASLEAALGRVPPSILDSAQAAKTIELISGNGARDLSAARFICQHGQRVAASGGHFRDAIVDYDYSGSLPDPVLGGYFCGAMADFQVYCATETDSRPLLRVDTRMILSAPDRKPRVWDPLNPKAAADTPNVQGEKEKPMNGYPVAPGVVQHAENDYVRVSTSVTFPEGGAALFRMAPPTWIEGENPEAIRKGERTLLMLVQGSQLNINQ